MLRSVRSEVRGGQKVPPNQEMNRPGNMFRRISAETVDVWNVVTLLNHTFPVHRGRLSAAITFTSVS